MMIKTTMGLLLDIRCSSENQNCQTAVAPGGNFSEHILATATATDVDLRIICRHTHHTE